MSVFRSKSRRFLPGLITGSVLLILLTVQGLVRLPASLGYAFAVVTSFALIIGAGVVVIDLIFDAGEFAKTRRPAAFRSTALNAAIIATLYLAGIVVDLLHG